MKPAIVWDLDGTLLDTLLDLTDATNYALAAFGYAPRLPGEVRQFVGNGAGQLIHLAVPRGTDADCEAQVLETVRRYYAAHCRNRTRPYCGIPEALTALRGYPMAVVSNKPDEAVRALCRYYFPGLKAMGEKAGCPRKPSPALLQRALAELGAERCIYVGDSEVDVETAQNAGVECLSVLWGFRDKRALEQAGAVHFCPSPEQLPESIRTMEERYGK